MSEPELVCPSCGIAVLDIDVNCGGCNAALSSTGAQRLIGEVVLGQYTIEGILGQGGMSVVYRGKHSVTGQEVALKVLPPDLAAYRDLKDRFLEEGRALAKLDHPNIVHLYNFGSDGDSLILAMQFVRGKTWERLITEEKRLSWERSARYTEQVADALDYAHGCGIIHRDMKPSNVLVRALDGAATVMDFGIAKVQSSTKLTATGQTMGTVRYMSPEQVRGREVDERTDIYSLAMTTYESLVGDTAFSGETHFEIMTKHLSEMPVAPSKRGVDLPPALETVLMRAIAKDPEDRQRSAREFKEQIAAAISSASAGSIRTLGLDPTTPSLSALPRDESEVDTVDVMPAGTGRRSLMLMLAGGVVAAAISVAFWGVGRSKKQSGRADRAAPVAKASTSPSRGEGTVATAQRHSIPQAYLLPGMRFEVDDTFADGRLRVLSVNEISASSIEEMIERSRRKYTSLILENNLPVAEEVLGLTLVFVPQSTMCNPNLYRNPSEQLRSERCRSLDAWYRPLEQTLYLAPIATGKLQGLLDYWVAATSCLHSDTDLCAALVRKRFGR